MKLKRILTICLAGVALGAAAQTHVEGTEYYKADQMANAKDLLERSLKNPNTDKAVSDYYLGLIALENGDKAGADKYFADGIAQNGNYAYNYVGQGRLALLNGDEKAAKELFKTAEKLAKKDASLEIAIARAYDSVDPALYEKQIAKAVENARRWDLQNPDIYIFEGDQFKEKKEWGNAAAKYEMAANYDKNATAAYVKYANLFTMVNPDYAIKMLKELLTVNPTSALGQRELANAYYNKKDYKNAAVQYGAYVKNPSHFKQDEDRYAFLLFYGGDYKKGYDYATALLQQNPKNFTAQRYQFMNAAQIKEMESQLLPLAEALYAAHKADPKANKMAPIDYTLIADEFSRAKRTDEGIAVLEEAIKDQPENANFNKQLAMMFVDKNNLAGAADAYKGYLAKLEEPGYNDFIQQATFSFYAGVENKNNPELQKKFFDETKEYVDKAAKILPDNYKPKKFYGDIAKQLADKAHVESAAAPYYEEAVALLEASADPSRYTTDAKEMYNYLGNYYLDQKDTAKAKSYFMKYLQYDPNNADYRKFVDSL